MNKQDRLTLRWAAAIISKEIEAGREIKIPRFGKFWLSKSFVSLDHPLSESGQVETHIQHNVKFRPFEKLKRVARRRRKRCERLRNRFCWHSDDQDHAGPCVKWDGSPYSS